MARTSSSHKKPAGESIPAGQFKARCLELMDRVRDRRLEVVITKRGKPVARLVPVEQQEREAAGFLKGTVRYRGDIVKPTGERWDADA